MHRAMPMSRKGGMRESCRLTKASTLQSRTARSDWMIPLVDMAFTARPVCYNVPQGVSRCVPVS